MKIKPFALERYFAKYEFSVKYIISASDCDGLSAKYLLSLADNETKKMWKDLGLGYTESQGLPLLREEIAKLYTGIDKDDVLVSAPEEGIFITMNTVLEKGDHVICVSPGYQSLYEIAESLGCEVTYWKPEEENNWRFNPEFLRINIKSNTKLVVINFPHNPTGNLASKEDFEEIINIVKEHNVYLFSDEMYRFLEYDESDRLPSAVEKYEKAISLFGMSKTYGLAGLRIGWIVTKDKDLYDRILSFKDFTTICNSAPSEILALIGLRGKDKIIGDNLEKIKRNLKLLDEFFARHKDLFSYIKPKAGTICFPKFRDNTNSFDFCESIVKEKGIMVLPSRLYEYGDKHFRIGFGRKNFPEVLKLFEEYVERKVGI